MKEKKTAARLCRVTIGDHVFDVKEGTRLGEFLDGIRENGEPPVMLVTVDGRLTELHKKIHYDCTIVPFDMTTKIGKDTYRRSLNLVFLKAVHDVCRNERGDLAVIHFSIGNAFYYTFKGYDSIDPKLIEKIEKRMRELVEADKRIVKKSVSTYRARQHFLEAGMPNKEQLLRYRRESRVNLYYIDDYFDYLYGYMAWRTGCLSVFQLRPYEQGVILMFPDRKDTRRIAPLQNSPKIFNIEIQADRWGSKMGIDDVADLNNCITEGKAQEKLLVAEALQESRISEIAEQILRKGNVKFVMIAGPSSSGKTTFSRRLSIQLSAHGMVPHAISLDNYYRDRADCPRDENGKLDFESIDALDLPLLEKNLKSLLAGEDVQLPYFNFTTGQPEFRGDHLQLRNNDILVLEGIHGLNDRISGFLPEEAKFRIYISALTQLNVDDHNRISTTDGRLIRRIIRDYRTRGTSARQTIAMWPSVRRGEENYIFPHQENADAMFNSAMLYEIAVLKQYIEPLLFQIPEDADEYQEAKRLLKFLSYFLGMPSENVPKNSILREFIGGSIFDV